MITRRALYCALAIAAAVLRVRIGSLVVRAANSTQPLTIEYRVENYTAPGGTLVDRRIFARRADGSTADAWYNPTPEGSKVQQRRVVDIARKSEIGIDSYTRSLMVKTLSDEVLGALKQAGSPAASCSGQKQPDQILGYDVYMLEQEATGTGHKRQVWRAPALGCTDLKRASFVTDNSGQWKIASEVTAVSIQLGDPSPHLFDIPLYPVRTHGDIAAEVKRRVDAAAASGKLPK